MNSLPQGIWLFTDKRVILILYMWDDCTEAEAMQDMYVAYEAYYSNQSWGKRKELTPLVKKAYVTEIINGFNPKNIGKWVVVTSPRKKKATVSKLYLVDRTSNKHTQWWWSPDALFAMVFNKQSAAEYQAKRYKYNNPRVIQITEKMTRYYNKTTKYDYEDY